LSRVALIGAEPRFGASGSSIDAVITCCHIEAVVPLERGKTLLILKMTDCFLNSGSTFHCGFWGRIVRRHVDVIVEALHSFLQMTDETLGICPQRVLLEENLFV